MAAHIRDIIEYHIGQDSEKFAEWAFGKDFRIGSFQYDAHVRWNKIHGDKLLLSDSGNPLEDIISMIKLWKERDD